MHVGTCGAALHLGNIHNSPANLRVSIAEAKGSHFVSSISLGWDVISRSCCAPRRFGCVPLAKTIIQQDDRDTGRLSFPYHVPWTAFEMSMFAKQLCTPPDQEYALI